ncbi:MAG: UDP-N-acetylmuramoyl-tripeptide--D-alanyl-D-alanine ligase [Paludibacteraceae bacterium]|nr:UDP-N-acetylmuramoyl-tripeptide--D-alanyl-D-alanine ligase [Paludibacteraceae bacterium]
MNWDFLIKDKESLFVTTDSRQVIAGCVFVALKGEHFDGNAFVEQAIEQGAAYVIKGENALAELQDLARAWRRELGLPIIAITGTNGKTTTKELTAAVLSTMYKLHYTQGNYNNSLGVPLTLLQITRAHELAIVEMGASHPGDIKELVEVAEPNYGLITNVGRAHLQGFGSFEGVQRTKAELYDYLLAHPETTKGIFINEDNEYLQKMLQTAGQEHNINITSSIGYTTLPMLTKTHLVGDYNAENISAALCVAEHFGIKRKVAVEAIRAYRPTNNRSQAMTTDKNELVIDAYNANPTSMTASIQSFCNELSTFDSRLSTTQKSSVFILGEMRELGEYSHTEHQNIVNMLLERKVKQVYLVGEEYRSTTAPYPIFHDVNELIDYLKQHPLELCRVLIKGSRGNQLEKILPVL